MHCANDEPIHNNNDEWWWKGRRHRDFGLPSVVGPGCLDWHINGVEVLKDDSFEWALGSRRLKFGLVFIFGLYVEDDLFTLIKETWKSGFYEFDDPREWCY